MSVKDKIKGIFGWLQARRFSVVAGQGVYIGKHCALKGKNNITLEDSVTVHPYAKIWSGGTVRIGRGSEIGERCRISIANSLNMGEKVLLSPNVYITDCDHEYRNLEVPVIDQGGSKRTDCVHWRWFLYWYQCSDCGQCQNRKALCDWS